MADFSEYKNVWVFCEQRQGELQTTDFELVSEATKLASDLGCKVVGLLLGDNVKGLANEIAGYGADDRRHDGPGRRHRRTAPSGRRDSHPVRPDPVLEVPVLGAGASGPQLDLSCPHSLRKSGQHDFPPDPG